MSAPVVVTLHNVPGDPGLVESASSLVMVPVAVAILMVAPADGFDRVTVKVSSDSTVASPLIATLMVFDVSPAAKVIVPVLAT